MSNRKNFINILIFFVFVCFKMAFANFDVDINKTSISMNEPVIIKITLDSNDGNLNIEDCADFSITNRNVFVNTEIVNFKASVKKTYEFTLFPNREGELKTPRFKISDDNGDSYIEPETITVSRDNNSSNRSSNNSSISRKNNKTNTNRNSSSIFDDEEDDDLNSLFNKVEKLKKQIFGNDDEDDEDSSNTITSRTNRPNQKSRRNRNSFFNFFRKPAETFVKSFVPNQDVYVNQQILYTIDFYVPETENVQIRLMNSINKDILIQQIEPENVFEKEYEGNYYKVHRMYVALYPMKTGEKKVEPFDINCFSSLYGSKVYKAEGFNLNVLELPNPKPEDFSQGVGNFDFNVSCDTEFAEVSKPFTLTLQVKGEGNASSVNLNPPILEGLDKFSDSETITRNIEDDKIIETKELKVVFVPSEGGEIEIPPITLSFFDPVEEKYYTKTSESIKLKVFGDKKKDKFDGSTGSSEIRALIKNNMTFRASDNIAVNPFVISISSLPFIMFLFLYAKNKISKMNLEANNSKSTGKAFSELKKDLKNCAKDDYGKVSESLVKYLANKLEIDGKGLTTKAIISELRNRCDDEELVNKIRDIFVLCDEARFNSDVVADSGTEMLIKSCISNVGELEKKLC